jgi:hypothetical protein
MAETIYISNGVSDVLIPFKKTKKEGYNKRWFIRLKYMFKMV